MGVTMENVHAMNAAHASEYDAVTKDAALDPLGRNSAAAAVAIRAHTDAELDRAAAAPLYSNAPVTCQFMLEDHAVRHSYHHPRHHSANAEPLRRKSARPASCQPGR